MRKDLDALADEGLILKVHGGVGINVSKSSGSRTSSFASSRFVVQLSRIIISFGCSSFMALAAIARFSVT